MTESWLTYLCDALIVFLQTFHHCLTLAPRCLTESQWCPLAHESITLTIYQENCVFGGGRDHKTKASLSISHFLAEIKKPRYA